jgi:nitroreductase
MSDIKTKVKKALPKKLLYYYYLYTATRDSLYDIKIRVKDKIFDNSLEERLKRDLTLAYHIVEKGLTMPEPRPGFGAAVVKSLLATIEAFEMNRFNNDCMEFVQSVSVLKEYLEYHNTINYNLDASLLEKLLSLKERYQKIEGHKQIFTSEEKFFQEIDSPFDIFCKSRYTVRNYSNRPVPIEVFNDCIDIAQKSPSFCNRQPTRVHIVKDRATKDSILALQNGNRGFGHLADTLLVITSIVSTTKDIHERFENHLNGGMFCMSLFYALHFKKVACCALNWSVPKDHDKGLRKILGIKDNEVILLVISCGYPPENFYVASSPRKSFSQITTYHI